MLSAAKPTGIPPAPVTASSVRITSYTTHGWRPTSVVTQPAISAITDSGPAATTARWNHAEPGQRGADRDHRPERQLHDPDRRPILLGHAVEALHDGVRVVEREQREQPRDLDPAGEVEPRAPRGLVEPLEGGELDGLSLGDGARRPVAHQQLRRRDERREAERHHEADAMAPVAPPAQPGVRVDAGHEEP